MNINTHSEHTTEMRNLVPLLSLFVTLFFLSGCKDDGASKNRLIISKEVLLAGELKIGLIPEQNVLKQKKRYKPLGNYIEKKTGLKIDFTILPRYGNIIDNFSNLKLDGAFWGSFTGAIAIRKLGIEHIVRPVNPDGTSTYKGYIFVRRDSNISTVADMKNRVIAFVDRATTAGYMFPVAYLKDHGVTNIDKYFREYYFTGSHDSAIYSVLDRESDIGCAKNTIYDMLAGKDSRIQSDLRIIAVSEEVPSNGLGLRKDININIKKRLKELLLNMHRDPDGIAILKDFMDIRFIENTEEDYRPVFEMALRAGINLANYEYNNK